MTHAMKTIRLLLAALAAVAAPAYGVQPPDPVQSDSDFNTAMGTGALLGVQHFPNIWGFQNTAAGFRALAGTTTGNSNTAIGAVALDGQYDGKRQHCRRSCSARAQRDRWLEHRQLQRRFGRPVARFKHDRQQEHRCRDERAVE